MDGRLQLTNAGSFNQSPVSPVVRCSCIDPKSLESQRLPPGLHESLCQPQGTSISQPHQSQVFVTWKTLGVSRGLEKQYLVNLFS